MSVFSKLSKLEECDRFLVLTAALSAVILPTSTYMALVSRPGIQARYGNGSSDGLSASQQEEITARLKPFMAERNRTPMQKEAFAEGDTRYEFNVGEAFVRATYDGDTNNCPRFKVVLKPEAGRYSTTQSLTVCPE